MHASKTMLFKRLFEPFKLPLERLTKNTQPFYAIR